MEVRYIVGHGWAERVDRVTALPHRVLDIAPDGSLTVRKSWAGEDRGVLLQMSAAELRLLAREHRREMRRRRWARIFG